MKTQAAFVALAFVLAAPSAYTQHASDVFGPAGPVGTIVPGAPFSAGIVTTWERVLPDGKRLQGEAHGKAYRDSQGRTRIEIEPEVPDPKFKGVVFISLTDPASRSITYLVSRTKRAVIRDLPTAVPPVAAATTPSDAKPPSDPDAPPPLGLVLSSEKPPRKSEELGSRELEGLAVTGTRVTERVTYGVLQGGGTITVTTTTWVSADLRVAVVTEQEDVRSDRLATKMMNIVRAEPDASLFQIPPGYTVADQRSPIPSAIPSNVEVLSDTQGVDFGPYLSKVVQAVRMNWSNVIPEVARPPLLKSGKVSIEFSILPDGRVTGMKITTPSGDVSMDRAAWGGITASNPFAPLPGQYTGTYLALRFNFYYNPGKTPSNESTKNEPH